MGIIFGGISRDRFADAVMDRNDRLHTSLPRFVAIPVQARDLANLKNGTAWLV
jgi:hypothetical protein